MHFLVKMQRARKDSNFSLLFDARQNVDLVVKYLDLS